MNVGNKEEGEGWDKRTMDGRVYAYLICSEIADPIRLSHPHFIPPTFSILVSISFCIIFDNDNSDDDDDDQDTSFLQVFSSKIRASVVAIRSRNCSRVKFA